MRMSGTRKTLRRMLRRALLSTVITVAGSAIAVSAAFASDSGFDDIEGSSHAKNVAALDSRGILAGTHCDISDTTRFCPDAPLDRFTMAVWLDRVLTVNGAAPSADALTRTRIVDVPEDDWRAAHVESLVVRDITKGCASTPPRFCPDDPVTRRQMATFLVRAFGWEPQDGAARATFADVEDNVHTPNITILVQQGVTAGCADSLFCLSRPVTRGQMATFLARASQWAVKLLEQAAPNIGWAAATDNTRAKQCLSNILSCLDQVQKGEERNNENYDRKLFGSGWARTGGCNTRYWVLVAESVERPQTDSTSKCKLVGGRWISVYDGAVNRDGGSGFDIDHMVPLYEAWGSGAHGWTSDRRREYYNDTGYEHSLIAVSASSNRSKGGRDPAEWMPYDNSGVLSADQQQARCSYASAWVTVKYLWGLTIDKAEESALRAEFANCAT